MSAKSSIKPISKSQTTNTTPSTQANGVLPPIQPISHLTTSAAQTFTHIHSALVPLIFLSRFSALVRDPVSTLTWLLIPIAILQGAYCAICLPTSGPSSTASSDKSKKKGATAQSGSLPIIPTILTLLASLTLPPLPIFALLVAHGAPITSHFAHTGLLALHISLLATPGLFYTRGLSAENWRQIVSLAAPIDSVQGAALGAILGCWIGAIPIPLDWDREWQRWPVTVVTGAYLGNLVGKLVGGSVAWGKTINFA